jgi:hypothetical protein
VGTKDIDNLVFLETTILSLFNAPICKKPPLENPSVEIIEPVKILVFVAVSLMFPP